MAKLITLIGLTVAIVGCTKKLEPAKETNCRGDACLQWTSADSQSCEQFDTGEEPKPPRNKAFQAIPISDDFTTPIHLFLTVKGTNASGQMAYETEELHYRISPGNELLPICAATRKGQSTEIYSQTLNIRCATNRTLASGATSASCQAEEKSAKEVKQYSGSRSQLLAMRGQREDSTSNLAPAALSRNQQASCSAICSGDDGASDVCLSLSSTAVNVALLNLIESWQPNNELAKSTALQALNVTDSCSRSATLISRSGIVENKGDRCEVEVGKLGTGLVSIQVPAFLEGRASASQVGKRMAFDTPHNQAVVTLQGALSVYGGPILEMNAVNGTRIVFLRTPTACLAIHEH